jgi:hypothetical protein
VKVLRAIELSTVLSGETAGGLVGKAFMRPNQQLNLTELAESIPDKLTAGSRLGLL